MPSKWRAKGDLQCPFRNEGLLPTDRPTSALTASRRGEAVRSRADCSAAEGRVMWRWCAYLSGVALIAVALVALPSGMIVESYVGGSAIHGYVEDGRYFVNPGHGRPIAEVSDSAWRSV